LFFCAHSRLKILNFSTNQNEFYRQIDRQNVLLVERGKKRVRKFWGARCSKVSFRDGQREVAHGLRLSTALRGFPLHLDDKETVVQSITPLQAVELRPRDRLLVVICDYQLADKSKAGADLEDRFVLAAESAGFNLNTALLPQGTAAS
jgi:hypothetical protein